jgi:hypothetical protein
MTMKNGWVLDFFKTVEGNKTGLKTYVYHLEGFETG